MSKDMNYKPEDLRKFIRTLTNNQGWVLAYKFESHYKWNPRYTRYLRSLTKGAIISGNEGYKATCNASPEERRRFIAKTRSAAHELYDQAQEVESFNTGEQGEMQL